MAPRADPVTDLLPLPVATFHVLVALQEGPLHGYGVKRRVEELSDGLVRMAPGTLYETLHRMLERGLIEPADEPEDGPDDRRQRSFYRLSTFGRSVVAAEVGRLKSLVDHAAGLLGGSAAG